MSFGAFCKNDLFLSLILIDNIFLFRSSSILEIFCFCSFKFKLLSKHKITVSASTTILIEFLFSTVFFTFDTLPNLLNKSILSLIIFTFSELNSLVEISIKEPGDIFKLTLVDLMLVIRFINQLILSLLFTKFDC